MHCPFKHILRLHFYIGTTKKDFIFSFHELLPFSSAIQILSFPYSICNISVCNNFVVESSTLFMNLIIMKFNLIFCFIHLLLTQDPTDKTVQNENLKIVKTLQQIIQPIIALSNKIDTLISRSSCNFN
ncbi:unnamed protein product [Paramecium primaurelia]|uniref:Uncharacterized protein n=1 Tax=Paramecium primaurelia TaxID=5886 RepID=A0A8S1JWI6_PARPR|nr:unnamed protein product [Paramecium primaurelia]